ncbi:MAG: EamA family transporter [Lawsonibacter sp.]|nr:EamA family transporter [Lawsonibacter sp.]
MEKKFNLSILVAAALWGCIGVFLKLLTAAGLSAMEGVAVRSTVAAIIYGLFLAFTNRKRLKIAPRHWYYFFGTGVCSLLFFNWCYFNAISSSSMSVAAVLLYTAPVFVTLMSAVFFREKITSLKIGALVLTFSGCVLVTGLLPLGQQSVSFRTILFGLGSGFGYALYSVFGKFALAKYPPSTVTFYTFLFSAACSLPFSGLHRHLILLTDGRAIVGGLGIGVLCCILPYLLYTSGLRHTEAGRAAILATAEPFVAALLGISLFHESVTGYKLLGMGAIFCAILLLNRPVKGKRD